MITTARNKTYDWLRIFATLFALKTAGSVEEGRGMLIE